MPGPNYGEPNYSGTETMTLMAPEHRSLTRSSSTGNALDEPSPLGLTLKKTPSLVDLIVMQLRSDESSPNADSIAAEDAKIRPSAKCLVPSAIAQDKLKASNFPASSLKIGTWEVRLSTVVKGREEKVRLLLSSVGPKQLAEGEMGRYKHFTFVLRTG